MGATVVPHWTDLDWRPATHDVEIDGRRIRYADHGDGPALVLLHGMGGCWQWWLEVLPELALHHRVIAVDLPGFGRSEPLPRPADIATHADIVAALVRRLGIDRVIVAGHSMGGLVSISLAIEHPELVDRLVLVDAGGVPMSERRLGAVLKLLRASYWTFTRPAVLNRLTTSSTTRNRMLKMAFRQPDSLSPELAREVIPALAAPGFLDSIAASARAVRTTEPERISQPTLLIWGAHDAFAPLHTAHAMLDRLPDGRLRVLTDVGHSPLVEAPSRFLEAMLPFTSGEPT